MTDVRIFVDDAVEMGAVYVDGRLKSYSEFYESEALISALAEFGVELEYDPDFMLGKDENDLCWSSDLTIDDIAQTVEEIEQFKHNRTDYEKDRNRERLQESVRQSRQQARALMEQADALQRELDTL